MNGPIDQSNPRWLSEQVRKLFEDEVAIVSKSNFLRSKDSQTGEGYLASSIEHLTTARSIFMDDARQFVTLVLVLFVGSGLLASYASSDSMSKSESLILFVAALVLLIFIFPVANALAAKARAAYEFYVASAIHASILHAAVGLRNTHQWFEHVYRNIADIENEDDKAIKGYELAKDWKRVIIHRWMQTTAATSKSEGNLFQSFNRLLNWARTAAWISIALGVAFMRYHLTKD